MINKNQQHIAKTIPLFDEQYKTRTLDKTTFGQQPKAGPISKTNICGINRKHRARAEERHDSSHEDQSHNNKPGMG